MAAQSKSTSARRKSKSVLLPKPTYLTAELRRQKANDRAVKEFNHFLDTAPRVEKDLVGHLKVYDYGGIEGLMKEIRRLFGESITKCKVIPFPVINKRLAAKEVQ